MEVQWKTEALFSMECFPLFSSTARWLIFLNISSKNLKRPAAMEINAQAKAYEGSNENFVLFLSLPYAGGIIGKVKDQ